MYKRNNVKIVSIKEMNEILTYVSSHYIMINGEKSVGKPFSNYAYYDDREINFSITFKKGANVCTFRCRKDGDNKRQSIYGGDAFRICKQYVGSNDIFDLRKDKNFEVWKKVLGWNDKRQCFTASARPILYSNPKYEGQRLKAYAYDVNSSYSNGMLQDMPDIRKCRVRDVIKENELGFCLIGTELICYEEIGKKCDFVFPRIESPFKKFVANWYAKKQKAKKDSPERQKAKEVLNYSVGYYQKVNPFIRARIISYANKVIKDLMDDNTLLCNTDSIVSLVPRKDIVVGNDIGDFKDDSKGTMFAYKGYEYQWDLKVPTYRKVSKKWFPDGWDILTDSIPSSGNLVKFNPESGLLEEVSYG